MKAGSSSVIAVLQHRVLQRLQMLSLRVTLMDLTGSIRHQPARETSSATPPDPGLLLSSLIAAAGLLLVATLSPHRNASATLPVGTIALFCCQFLNPGNRVVALPLAAAFPPLEMLQTLAWPIALFVPIPTANLLPWALLGPQLAAHLRNPGLRHRVDRIMGQARLASARLLLL